VPRRDREARRGLGGGGRPRRPPRRRPRRGALVRPGGRAGLVRARLPRRPGGGARHTRRARGARAPGGGAMTTRTAGVALAFAAAIVSGVSIYVNGRAVKHFGDATVYTTAKNLVAGVLLLVLALSWRRASAGSAAPRSRRQWLGLVA